MNTLILSCSLSPSSRSRILAAEAARLFRAAEAHVIELDLRNVEDLAELDGHEIDLDANAGELVVILPAGVGADVQADIDFAGAIDLPGNRGDEGFGAHADTSIRVPNQQATIDLELDLDFGHIEVRTAS